MSNKDVKKFFTDSLHGTRVTELSSISFFVHTPREREREIFERYEHRNKNFTSKWLS